MRHSSPVFRVATVFRRLRMGAVLWAGLLSILVAGCGGSESIDALEDGAPPDGSMVTDGAPPNLDLGADGQVVDSGWVDGAAGDASTNDTDVEAVDLGPAADASANFADASPPDAGPISCPQDDPLEDDDSLRQAAPLAPGPWRQFALCSEDEDWRIIDACPGTEVRVELQFTHADGDLDLQLVDGSDVELAKGSSVDDDELAEYTVGAEAERIYARIYGYEGASNSYLLRASYERCAPEICEEDAAEPDDSQAEARLTAPGEFDRTVCAGDDDWLEIPVCAGASVLVSARFRHADGDLDLHLFDGRGVRVRRSTSSTDNESVVWRALEDTTVYARIFGYRQAENSYALQVLVEGDCSVCGDGIVSAGEACDDAPPDCVAAGFDFGEARCTDACEEDLAGCGYSRCGDGVQTAGEACDRAPVSCRALGLGAGSAPCGPGCQPDLSACPGGYGVTGVARYQRVTPVCNPFVEDAEPCQEDDCCLDPRPEARQALPIGGALIQAVDPDTQAVLAEAFTAEDGGYSLRWPEDRPAEIVIFSYSQSPRITVVDNTDDGSIYGYSAGPVRPERGQSARLDLLISAGFSVVDGQVRGFDKAETRQAAPFAVLTTLREIQRRVEAARPALDLPPLLVNWSVNNGTCSGRVSNGCIGTSYFDGRALYILGEHGVDTDEFDTHVLAHEFSHFLERAIGRSDSPGGSHSANQVKDISLAMAEGQGNALSAILLYPQVVYVDTRGEAEGAGFFRDLEDNEADNRPGFFNERTIERLVYDLFDPFSVAEPLDDIALSLGALIDVIAAQRRSEAITSLFSFITHVKALNPLRADAVDRYIERLYRWPSRCSAPQMKDCGLERITNVWGDGERHDGGWQANLPPGPVAPRLHVPLEVDGPAHTLEMRHTGDAGEGPGNWLSEVRYFRFLGAGAAVSVSLDCPDDIDVDLWTYRRGRPVGVKWQTFGEGGFGDERMELYAPAGVWHAARVRGDDFDAVDPYRCTIRVESL